MIISREIISREGEFKPREFKLGSLIVISLVMASVSTIVVAEKAPPIPKRLPQDIVEFIKTGKVPLGLPALSIPKDNPLTVEKVKLGNRLYDDERFSADGKVSCATCHNPKKGFTDNLPVSKGFSGLTGTRSAPTVINAAYMKEQFWDGREPTLESQSLQPPINPVEGGLQNHNKILEVIRGDRWYTKMFKRVFRKSANNITMKEVSMAIASFERTVLSGNSRFDHYYFMGDEDALNTQEKRGFAVFLGNGRCVSCHVVEQNNALFIDNKYHNIGIGFKKIKDQEAKTASLFIEGKRAGANVDITVLSSEKASELGRFAVSEKYSEIGAFKTPTIREIEHTAPYMHDGSLKTLEEVVTFYNNGGRLKESDPLTPFLSGGIKPLHLTKQEQKDLVAFMKTLNSNKFD